MDRRTVYPGQLPRDVDWLAPQQNAMVGLGGLTEALIGTSGAFDGFAVGPSFPTSLTVQVGRGSVYQSAQIEASAWSSLPVDTRQIVKQGLLLSPTALTLIPPVTFGYAQKVLIQIAYDDRDDGDVVLPFYNAANPSQPYLGQGNTNQPLATNRRGAVRVDAKYGIAAPAGTETVPAPDAGWLGVAVVSLAQGQSTISGASIAEYAPAPRIRAKLLELPYAVQDNRWRYAVDSGLTASALVATLFPAPVNCNDGFGVRVKLTRDLVAGATLNVNGFSGAIVRASGKALATGDALAGDIVDFVRNNGAWVLLGLAASSAGSNGSGDTDPATFKPVITTATVKTVGGTSPDFADLIVAYAWASLRRIAAPGSLTFQCAAGQFTYPTSVLQNHPDGGLIFVKGATLKAAVPTPAAIATTGYTSGAQATDTANALVNLRASYATELYFTGGASFTVLGNGNIQDILITTDKTSAVANGLNIQFGTVSLTRVSVASAGANGVGVTFGLLNLYGTCHFVGNGNQGIRTVAAGAVVTRAGSTLSLLSNASAGILLIGTGVLDTDDASASGPPVIARGNGNSGIFVNGGRATVSAASQANQNANDGVTCNNSGFILCSGMQASNNANHGFDALAGGNISGANTTGSGNGGFGYQAVNAALIVRTGGAATGTSGSASPAVGSVGNGQAQVL